MATLTYYGLDELVLSFEAIAELPDDVMKDMLNAGADVIIKEQTKNCPVRTGRLRQSIVKKKPFVNQYGGFIAITFDGIHHTNKSGGSRYRKRGSKNGGATRNGEVAFILEYGAPGRNIEAREWILKANEQCEKGTTEAQAKVLDAFYKKNKF